MTKIPLLNERSKSRTRSVPNPFSVKAKDGYTIKGYFWRELKNSSQRRPVVIINSATSVRCRYYFPFAVYLFERGFNVIVYDYRGIGESRPETLRGFDACWIDWGSLDFNAVLQYADTSFPGQPIYVVAHSVGGFVLGFARSNHLIQRIFMVGAQYAFWGDYASGAKLRMLVKWHLIMPLITALFGYFPGKRLGWLEDTPKGVVWNWVFSRKRFEDTWAGRESIRYPDKSALMRQFLAITASTLAVSVTDDEFGTISAVERLLRYFGHSPRTHLRISPESIAEPSIGHFDFFNSRFENKLWHIPLTWLESGQVSPDWPGELIATKR